MPGFWEGLCGTADQDWGFQSDNSSLPELSECFQNTVLTWIPCVYMLLLGPAYIVYLCYKKSSSIPLSWLNVTKCVFGAVLVCLSLAETSWILSVHYSQDSVFLADILAPSLRFLTFCVATAIILLEKKAGVRSSFFHFMHWLLQVFAFLLIFMAKIRIIISTKVSNNYKITFSFVCLYTVCTLVQLVLSCFNDERTIASSKDARNVCPEKRTTFLSRITFWWFNRIIIKGYKRPLTTADLWELNPEDTSFEVVSKFEKAWQKDIESHKQKSLVTKVCPDDPKQDVADEEIELDSKDPQNSAREPLNKKPDTTIANTEAEYHPKLGRILFSAFCGKFILGSFFKFIHDCLIFVSPAILRYLIQFTLDKEEATWKGYFCTFGMFIVAMVQSLVLHQYFHASFITGMRLRTAVIASVYRKALKLSNDARKTSTVGEMVNLMSVDAQKFMELTTYLNMLWSAPFQMTVCLVFLYMTLGPSIFAGVAVMVLLIPINAWIAKKTRTLQMAQMKQKDNRIKQMNEILNGIRVLKLYAWELPFQDKILGIRQDELKILKKAAYLTAASSFTWTCAPFLVSLVTFGVYVMASPENILNAEKAFVSLALFNILRFPLSILPMLIANIVQARVSLKRVADFLKLEELDQSNVDVLESKNSSVSMKESTFSWGKEGETVTLNKIDLDIKDGSLVAVVGQVGSGKSSLLAAMLGEMEKLKGSVLVKGSTAFVAQQAWIQNATLKDNILFNSNEDSHTYERVVDACALKPDLEILPGGDQTEIGEKGINLSGGQKQRVSLARAVYSDADIYLMDDPLSAVDSHVGKHIFENVIGKDGLLKNKTRILVTHALNYLQEMDKIIVVVDGAITETGTYKELLDQNGAFADFLKTHHIHAAEEDDEALSDDESVTSSRKRTLSTRDRTVSENPSNVSDADRVTSNPELSRLQSVNGSLKGSQILFKGSQLLHKGSQMLHKGSQILVENAKKEEADANKIIQSEDSETGRVKLSVFLYYIKALGALISFIIVFMFTITNAASLYANIWLADWSDDKAEFDNGTIIVDTDQRDLRLGVYGALGFIQAITTYIAAFALAKGGVLASAYLHKNILFNCLRSPIEFFDTTPMGRILNRFSKDIDVIDTIIPKNLEAWIKCTYHVIGSLIILSISTPYIITVVIPLGIFYFLIQRFYIGSSRQLKRIESVSRSPIYSHFSETIQGVTTIRAYKHQDRFITELNRKVDENQMCYYPSIVSNRWLAVRLEFVGNCIVMFAALFAVIGRDHLRPGIVGLSLSYALNITQVLNWMVRMTSELETNIVAVERVKEYTETPTEAEWEVDDKNTREKWPENGEVKFVDYSARYREGLELSLKTVNFNIQSQEKIGIVGRTGAGKSSLTMALFRIFEAASGSIKIDDVTIAKIGLHELRSRISIIPQDPVVFSGSLRMNLDPFSNHTDDEILDALEHAHLKKHVMSLPDGLEHQCTEGGDNLSVGQKQLVCLARALLRRTKILVLDEATAAVDHETDKLIQTTIRNEFSDCTILTIAHRLNTILDYSRILVLKEGEVVEFDTPDKLLTDSSGIFYSMVKDAGLLPKME